MTLPNKATKEACFILIKNKGECCGEPYVSCVVCPLEASSRRKGCKDSYKIAVKWAMTYCKDELLELLI